LPKGPLTQLTIEITATTGAGERLRVIEAIAEHINMHTEPVAAHFPVESHAVTLKDIGLAPIGLYLMLGGTAAQLLFRISGPAFTHEVGLEL
jgi:hypothetical protein